MASKELQVAFFLPTLSGGVGRINATLAHNMVRKGIATEVWSITRDRDIEKTIPNIPVYKLGKGNVRSSFFSLWLMLIRCKPKVLITSSFHANCVAILANLLTLQKTQTIVVEHIALKAAVHTLPFWKKILIKLCIRLFYRHANIVVAVSQQAADDVAFFANVPRNSIKVIYNPVITKDMIRMSAEIVEHSFFNENSNDLILLAVGRLSPQKDFATLIKAFSIVRKSISAKLIILGEGEDREKLNSLIKELNIEGDISLPGHVTNPYPYFKKADLFVLSSIYEGLPTVLIEALALGTKVVSTDCPSGPNEILEGGKLGLLSPIQDSDSLAKSIIDTLQKPKNPTPSSLLLEKYQDNIATEKYIELFRNKI